MFKTPVNEPGVNVPRPDRLSNIVSTCGCGAPLGRLLIVPLLLPQNAPATPPAPVGMKAGVWLHAVAGPPLIDAKISLTGMLTEPLLRPADCELNHANKAC